MTAFFSDFAQEDLPRIEYFGVDHEQAECALKAAKKFVEYEVTLMPIDTPEEALATAQERDAHLQAKGDADAKEQGAVMIFSSRKELSPEEFAIKLHRDRATQLLMRVRLPKDASLYELFRDCYDKDSGPESDPDQ